MYNDGEDVGRPGEKVVSGVIDSEMSEGRMGDALSETG
jgi:hypothetical protein